MATTKKISELDELTTPSADDDFEIRDKSDNAIVATGKSKRMTWLTTITKMFASRFGADAGSTDTYVVTLDPVPLAYVTGEHYRFKANTANTGACTVNFNSLGAKTIKKAAGGITTDLTDNDIRAGQWVDLVYDGTNMQMQSLLGNAPSGGLSTEDVQDIVGAMLVAGTNITITYNDPAGTLTIDAAGGGGSTNPTSLFVPYNNAGTFDDSRIKRENTNITALNGGVNTAQTFKVYRSDDGSGNAKWIQIAWNGSDSHEILSTASGSGGVSNMILRVDGGGSGAVLGTGGFQPVADRGLNLGGGSNRWNQGLFFQCVVDGGDYTYQNNWKLTAYGDGFMQMVAAGGSGGDLRFTLGDSGSGTCIRRPSGVDYLEIKDGSASNYKGLRTRYAKTEAVTFANLPASPVEGMMQAVTDSTTATWGATITGGGSNHVLAYYNGTNWTVAAA